MKSNFKGLEANFILFNAGYTKIHSMTLNLKLTEGTQYVLPFYEKLMHQCERRKKGQEA